MKRIANSQMQIVTGETQEELTAAFDTFLETLENEDKEYTVLSVNPALLVIICEGDPIYEDIEEEGPRIEEPFDSVHNKAWLEKAGAESAAEWQEAQDELDSLRAPEV